MAGLNPMQITGQLRIRGLFHKDVAERLGLERSTVTHTIRGRRRNPDVQGAIARLIGMTREEVFGDEMARTGTDSH